VLDLRFRFKDSPHPITASVMGSCPFVALPDMIRRVSKLLIEQDVMIQSGFDTSSMYSAAQRNAAVFVGIYRMAGWWGVGAVFDFGREGRSVLPDDLGVYFLP
jgi:hypothetical protein